METAARDKLFRKVALDRLSSPEQLDTMVRVVTPRAWLALAPLLALLAMVLAWGIWGSIPTKVSGKAMLFQSGGLRDVSADSAGRIAALRVQVGDSVKAGQVVAVLAQPELEDQQRNLRSRMQELLRQQTQLQEQTRRGQALARALQEQQQAALQAQLAAAEERVRVMSERVKSTQGLAEQGQVPRQTFLNMQNELAISRHELESVKSSLRGSSLQRAEDDKRTAQELTAMANQVSEAQRALASSQATTAGASAVLATEAGRVVELKVTQGTLVARGSTLLTLEPSDSTAEGEGSATLEAVIFIPAAGGKRIEPGMQAQIVPSTVKREEHGYMLSSVRYVSEYAATDASMMLILQNRQLVQELSAGGSPIEVRASFIRADTVSGYRWSSADGPPFAVRTGTPATAEIVVYRQAPISLVIPLLKKAFGV